ncbi:O-antigen ligase family protein [Cesiribacter andamanensis]|uniref:O-antigen ligase family protein n=1 Tax=Cesiribacter andamanensis TaxID=649507 RepID=UPI00034D4F17|nr:O-antigen ligase family protein [Cesiribacter andamanensis]
MNGLIFYPQEFLLPVLLLLYLILNKFKLNYAAHLQPYYFLLAALGVILLSSSVHLYFYPESTGFFKTVKYLLYVFCIVAIADYDGFDRFLVQFNKIAFWVIVLSLMGFLYSKHSSGLSWGSFMQRATWKAELMPSGFSNLIYNFSSGSFVRYTGNHGIYGTYLVLIYLLNIGSIFSESIQTTRLNYVLLGLVLINLGLLTAREALLVFVVLNMLALFLYFTTTRFKLKHLVGSMMAIAAAVCLLVVLWNLDVNIVLINKLKYTMASYEHSGGEANISARTGVWMLTLYSFAMTPWRLLTGYGFNRESYIAALEKTNAFFDLHLTFAGVPESYFFTLLAYGGVLALLFGVFYFLIMFYQLRTPAIRKTLFGRLLFCFMIGVLLSNNTGASVLADLLITQLALAYMFIVNHAKKLA